MQAFQEGEGWRRWRNSLPFLISSAPPPPETPALQAIRSPSTLFEVCRASRACILLLTMIILWYSNNIQLHAHNHIIYYIYIHTIYHEILYFLGFTLYLLQNFTTRWHDRNSITNTLEEFGWMKMVYQCIRYIMVQRKFSFLFFTNKIAQCGALSQKGTQTTTGSFLQVKTFRKLLHGHIDVFEPKCFIKILLWN